MSIKKLSVVLGVLLIASMVLTACPAPQPQVVEKVVTQVVEQKVEVVQTQIVEVEKVVEKEKVVVATAAPEVKTPLLRVNIGTYPDVIDPQKSSLRRNRAPRNDVHGPDDLQREAGDGSRCG